WHIASDHTGNADGKMIVANGQAEIFYSHTVTNTSGFGDGFYSLSAFAMNVDTPGTCSQPKLTTLTYTVEYLDASNAWVPLVGSPYVAAPLQQEFPAKWVSQGALINLPAVNNFTITSIRIKISDGTVGGCGNDFALDDISFAQCPINAPTPVEFLNISARQKGSGVSVDWSTSQEFNSDYFDLEKSVDGNFSWTYVNTVKAAGNSSVVKNYNIYDAKPFSGNSFYRLKQVDKDGKFKYSKTVKININISKTGVSVLANPFRSVLTVDFLSSKDEIVHARLIDITGRVAANENWSVTSGSTRKEFSNVTHLQPGMYILNVSNAAGEILYNNKVIKQ
ncbi:MAG: T9SS type A sorting domain-containing protein, partial [Ginsengibacter sp.]